MSSESKFADSGWDDAWDEADSWSASQNSQATEPGYTNQPSDAAEQPIPPEDDRYAEEAAALNEEDAQQ